MADKGLILPDGFWSAGRCECCHSTVGVHLRKATFRGERVQAALCEECFTAQHSMSYCIVGPDGVGTPPMCGARVWQCQELHHAKTAHPEAIEYRLNQPEERPREMAGSNLTYLGRLDLRKMLEG